MNRISLINSYSISEKRIDFSKLIRLEDQELQQWWHMVPGSRAFINAVANAIYCHEAVAAHIFNVAMTGFLEILREKLMIRHGSMIVEVFNYDADGDMEEFTDVLAEKYAANFLRDFTEDSPMADFAKQNLIEGHIIIILLKAKYSWLTAAVADYNRCNAPSGGSLIFITDEDNPPPSLTRMSDYLTPYDIQFFASIMLQTSRLSLQEKLYTSTLVSKMAGDSPILAKNLTKPELLSSGADFVKKIIPNFDERSFNRAIWESQIQFLLPILEQIRGRLIEKNFIGLKNILPVIDEFGTALDDPWDMELRHLHYYGGNRRLFQFNDWEWLEIAYNARNDLSHLKTIDLAQMQKLLAFAD